MRGSFQHFTKVFQVIFISRNYNSIYLYLFYRLLIISLFTHNYVSRSILKLLELNSHFIDLLEKYFIFKSWQNGERLIDHCLRELPLLHRLQMFAPRRRRSPLPRRRWSLTPLSTPSVSYAASFEQSGKVKTSSVKVETTSGKSTSKSASKKRKED